MNSNRRQLPIVRQAIGPVIIVGIGIAVVLEIIFVVNEGLDYIPYLFVCIAGLILVTFFYGFQNP
jgi:flagellar biosynthesis protein FliQ